MTGELERRSGQAGLPALAQAVVDIFAAIREIGSRLLLAAKEGWYYVVDVLPVVLKYQGAQVLRDFWPTRPS